MRIIVEKSLSGRTWTIENTDEQASNAIAEKYNLPRPVADLLLSRDISDIENFLNPSIKNQMPDPFVLHDMELAISHIKEAILSGKKIGIFGDYDVDGITSTAILIRYFKAINFTNYMWILPNREGDGYGLNTEAIDKMHSENTNVLICVDCGISAVKEVDYANSLDMTCVILDHHESENNLPNAVAVVDPKRNDDTSGLNYLAAVGVCFLFLVGLNRALREAGYFEKITEPNLMDSLDMVALGTVCDTMSLIELNRAFVATGLKVLKNKKNLGIKTLLDASGTKVISVYTLGFVLGPRLNAAGRLTSADKSLELLLSQDQSESQKLASDLVELNDKRKDIESITLASAIEKIDENIERYKNFIFVFDKSWHGGVMGIIAGRLKDKYNRPTCVATLNDSGIINGSGRSIAEIDLGKIIMEGVEQGILSEGGGHAAAVGFSLVPENTEKFLSFASEKVCNQLGDKCLTPTIKADVLMDLGGVNRDLLKTFEQCEPYGQNNFEPKFILTGATFMWSNVFGNGHIKLSFKASNGTTIQAMLFNGLHSDLGKYLLEENNYGKVLRICGRLKENEYNGRTKVQLILEDISED